MAKEMLTAEPQTSYPVEKVGDAYRSVCRCGWQSEPLAANADALGDLVRHRHAEHR